MRATRLRASQSQAGSNWVPSNPVLCIAIWDADDRVAGLVSREQKELAVEIIEAEIRNAQYEIWLEASRLVLTGEPIEVAHLLRQQAERTIRPARPS